MSFTIGRDSMLEAPKKVNPLLLELLRKGNYRELFYMRRMLVFEMLEAADRLRGIYGYSNERIIQIKARIRGIQWRMEVDMGVALMYSGGIPRSTPRMSEDAPIDILACGFWDGVALVSGAAPTPPKGFRSR